MSSKRFGLLAMIVAATVLWVLPSASVGKPAQLLKAQGALRNVTTGLGTAVQSTVDKTLTKTDAALKKARDKAAAALAKKTATESRATATDPKTQPPLHGSNPHAQGGVAVVDLDPSSQRPLDPDPSGKASGEDVIVGRARGEEVNGVYHGHITIASLFGSEIAGVDTTPGQTKNGPLQPLQSDILDPLCTNSKVCLSVLTANSTTTATGSTNDFAVARASLLGLGVGAAESHGDISQDSTCQTSVGSSKTANVVSTSGAIAQVANASSTSKSCQGSAPQVTNTSQVIGLGGVQVPIPAAGCANGTPDTVSGIAGVLPIVCNADDIAGAAAVREALDVYVLQVGGTSLAKETTAAAESVSVAPAASETGTKECSDGIDNDGDGKIDAKDPGCHSDNNAGNSDSYNPNDNDETDRSSGGTGGSSNGNGGVQCADKKDNDGDGLIDAKDPGCHTDGNANNPASYDASDNSEAGGGNGGNGNGGGNGANAGTGGQSANAGTLPFTGTDVVGLSLAGLLMLAGGLLLRRREDSHAAR
jgi:LPXTG-motif cell wall-anchored protein